MPMKILVAILLVFSAAFDGARNERSGRTMHSGAKVELTGVWETRISFSDGDGDASGVIALIPDAAKQYIWVGLEDANYFGVYSADLQSGVAPASTICPYRMVAARSVGDSAVTVVLNPSQDHGAIRLTGTIRGAEIEGDAVETSYGAGRKGTFSMRRRSQ